MAYRNENTQPTSGYQVTPGTDGTFAFEDRDDRGNAPSDRPAPQEKVKAEAIQNLGLQEAKDTGRRLLELPAVKVDKSK